MSLKIIKAGIFDSIQDLGRFGYRQFGINPTGSMDCLASSKANLIVNNDMHEAVIELHFPASILQFEQSVHIAITGADFSARIDGEKIPQDEQVFIRKNSILTFEHPVIGARAYLAIKGGLDIPQWLQSWSTNMKAACGGWQGRRLMKGDSISFRKAYVSGSSPSSLGAMIKSSLPKSNVNKVLVLQGHEWNWLSHETQDLFLSSGFTISNHSDRMGYRLSGPPLHHAVQEELVSSPVCFGTIQLLPDGQLMLLMADHQTTGGYPRIAYVISAHASFVAQKRPGDSLHFELTDIAVAENLLFEQFHEIRL
ncbi:MAG: biotin-dependent carboxyltransferase family protein [Saprospiraceae bacterium]